MNRENMDDITDRITDILFAETARIVFADTGDDLTKRAAAVMSMSAKQLAEALVSELGLHIEGRQLSDGEGGMSINSKTGETTSHGKPCTLQIRWATRWIKDDKMSLPLAAYIQTPLT
jgi:hypothetical protein